MTAKSADSNQVEPRENPLAAEPVRPVRSRRVEPERLLDLTALCEFIVLRLDQRGRYIPPESLFIESIGYRSSLGGYLAEAGRVLREPRYVEAGGRILRDVISERIGDMWPVGVFAEFPIYRGVEVGWREKFTVNPDVRYTALSILGLGLYYRASGDQAVVEPARRAFVAIFERWDFEVERQRRDWLVFELLGMAVAIWEKTFPEYAPLKQLLLRDVLDTFVAAAPKGFAFLTMYRVMFILNETGNRYLESHLKPGIDAVLAEPKWRCPENYADFYHIEKTADHVNIRGNGAVALMLRLYDLAAARHVYRDTPVYRHVTEWLQGQRREDGAYYGCREHGPGEPFPMSFGVRPMRESRRYSLGSPDQYLPLLWLMGGSGETL